MPDRYEGAQFGFEISGNKAVLSDIPEPRFQHIPGRPPLTLSLSRLERIASELAKPSEKQAANPKKTLLPQHFRQIVGIGFHRAVELSERHSALQTSDIHRYREEYLDRLSTLGETSPTEHQPDVRGAIEILSDSRLIFPRVPYLAGARRTAAHIIADHVLNRMKQLPPFTATDPLGRVSSAAELEFPSLEDPEEFTDKWNQTGQTKKLHAAIDKYVTFREAGGISPALPATLFPHLGISLFASELRVTAFLPGTIFSFRADNIRRGKTLEAPQTHVTIDDWKIGKEDLPPERSIARKALDAGLLMMATSAAALPRQFGTATRAINLKRIPLKRPDKNTDVRINYICFGDPSPHPIDMTSHLGNLHHPKDFQRARDNLDEVLAIIATNADRLAPLLR